MSLSNRSLPKPENWQDFEFQTWLLFRAELNDPATEQNGRQGQAQHGVDVFGRRKGNDWVGIQCKQKMDEGVSEAELRAEVTKAKSFDPKISEFILVTTARRDATIQKVAREITDELSETDHTFTVSVWGWDQFQEHASLHSDVWEKIDPTWDPFSKRGLDQVNLRLDKIDDRISSALPNTRNELRTPDFVSKDHSQDSPFHTKVSVFVEMINNGDVDAGQARLETLKENDWKIANITEKYRLLIGLASAALKLGSDADAYSLIERAYDICPEHKSAKTNLATSKLLQRQYDQAKEIAKEALLARPEDEGAAAVLIQARSFDHDSELMEGITDEILDHPAVKAALCQAARNRDDPNWTKLAIEAFHVDETDEQIRLNWAEAVLELEIRSNARSAQGGISDFPVFADLEEAAEILFQDCISKRSRFSLATIHNAGLTLRLVDRSDDAKRVLEFGLALYPEEPSICLQMAIIAHEAREFDLFWMVLDSKSEHPEALALRVEAVAHVLDPAKALEQLESIDQTGWSEEHQLMMLSSEMTALSKMGDWATAILKCNQAAERNPSSIRLKILLAKVLRFSGDMTGATSCLEAVVAELPADMVMAERVEIASEYRQLENHDGLAALLEQHVSIQHDSEALRLLVSALISGQKHRRALELYDTLPNELANEEWYLRARAILAINSGDAETETHLNSYLRAEPNDLEMQISRMGLWQLSDRSSEIRRKLRSFENSSPEGTPLERMRLCHLAVQYGNKTWGVKTAYQELIGHWDDPAVHLAYQGLILMYDDLEDAVPKITTIQENCVFETRSKDGIRRARIEATSAHNFDVERHVPDSDFAKACLGKAVGEIFTISTQFEDLEFEVLWIKPKALDLLHRSLEEFNQRFPLNSGMQRMSIDTGGENPLEDMERITKAANDRDQAVLDNYAKNALPFSFVAKALGKDPIDGWAGLPSVGIQPRVCIGSLEERNAAITSIQAREVNGCVLDPITAALASDFHLWKTVSQVCGQIHVTQSTLEVFAKREIEAQNNIDRQTGIASWQNGHLAFIEITPEQNRSFYEEKSRQREDILAHCRIASAVPKTDLAGQNLEISEMLGSAAMDSILAADGGDLLFLSEDQGLRQWAGLTLEVGVSWLQPVMLIAKDRELISTEDYTKFIVDCLKRGFTYISMDPQTLFTQAKADGYEKHSTIKQMLEVVGGKNADLLNNMGVAATFLDLVMRDTKSVNLRNRYASMVLDTFSASRPDKKLEVVKALIRQVSLQGSSLVDHSFWWLIGQQIGTPQFDKTLAEVRRAQLKRPLVLTPAVTKSTT